MLARFRTDFSTQAMLQGLVVAVVGYASSVAVVINGLAAVGASTAEIASALMWLGVAKGLLALGLSLRSRMPISIAWTTPGLALLATSGAVSGGFPAAVGAFIVCAGLVVLSGLWPVLARAVAAIPKPIANAMLAGVLLKLCLAPFFALKAMPLLAGAILLTWFVVFRFARLYAVPAAMAVTLVLLATTGDTTGAAGALVWPQSRFVWPVFKLEALFSIAIPLFVVTMASQAITGLAVLSACGYRPDAREGLVSTGIGSALIAPFGAPTVSYAAITAALCAGPDAHADPTRRYVAAVFSGVGYIALAALAGVAAVVLTRASPLLVEAAAGLALMSAFGSAMLGAAQDENSRIPAMIAFLVTASGFGFAGIGGAFWGLALGWAADAALKVRVSA